MTTPPFPQNNEADNAGFFQRQGDCKAMKVRGGLLFYVHLYAPASRTMYFFFHCQRIKYAKSASMMSEALFLDGMTAGR